MKGLRPVFASLVALGALLTSASALAQTVIVSRPGYGPVYGPAYGPYAPGPYYSPYPPPYPPPPPPPPPPPVYVPPPAYVPPPPPPPPRIVDVGFWGFTASAAGLYSAVRREEGFGANIGARTFWFRSPVEPEFELGFARFDKNDRNDYKLGLNIHGSFSKGVVVPYIVVPLALHVVTSPRTGADLQGSAGLGLGLGVRFWHLMISADARAHYQDDFEGPARGDLVGEARLTLSILPFKL